MIQTLQGMLSHPSDFHPALQFLVIAISVGVSEEFAAIAVFALARHGSISWWVAGSGVFAGAWAAQALIWLAGRMAGHRALSWRIFAKLRDSGKLESIHQHVVHEGWIAVVIMRFVPGTRIPVCLGAGILGMGAWEFLGVLTLATIAWVLALMGLFQTLVEAIKGKPLSLLVGVVLIVPLIWFVRLRIKRNR